MLSSAQSVQSIRDCRDEIGDVVRVYSLFVRRPTVVFVMSKDRTTLTYCIRMLDVAHLLRLSHRKIWRSWTFFIDVYAGPQQDKQSKCYPTVRERVK